MEYFKNIGKINYEGKDSKNPLSFKYYDKNRIISGKPMKEHLRFAMSYWHTLTGDGSDPFGKDTMERPWNQHSDLEKSKIRAEVGFELMEKLGIEYFCFHDLDIAPEGENLKERNENLDIMVNYISDLMTRTGIKCLWGTTNAFTNKRFVHGASTSPNAEVFAYAAAQVKKAMEITKKLNGENYVFWGGREGYETLLNTDTGFELDNLARFLKMAVNYKEKINFKGQLLIEPKPKEPTKHQYDFDAATVAGFLRKYDLIDYFKLNIEANHATLANHTFEHELNFARNEGLLGSIDANQGDLLLGWDTDQFPTNIYDATFAMIQVLKNNGLAPGGLNFDAKVRRGSFEMEDLLHAYIAGMDTYAKGLIIADKIVSDGIIDKFVEDRYISYKIGIGEKIISNSVGFEELEEYALNLTNIENKSGKQEYLENIINNYIYG
jgi:xylose isomerase